MARPRAVPRYGGPRRARPELGASGRRANPPSPPTPTAVRARRQTPPSPTSGASGRRQLARHARRDSRSSVVALRQAFVEQGHAAGVRPLHPSVWRCSCGSALARLRRAPIRHQLAAACCPRATGHGSIGRPATCGVQSYRRHREERCARCPARCRARRAPRAMRTAARGRARRSCTDEWRPVNRGAPYSSAGRLSGGRSRSSVLLSVWEDRPSDRAHAMVSATRWGAHHPCSDIPAQPRAVPDPPVLWYGEGSRVPCGVERC